jgi:tetratricopeptide (TPR) repeat protein
MPRYRGRFNEALNVLEVGMATDRMELGECSDIAGKLFMKVLINDCLGRNQSVVADLRQAIAILEGHEARNMYAGLFRAYLAAELTAMGDTSTADSVMLQITGAIMARGYPDSTFYWLASGFTHFKLKQYDTAALLCEKIIALEPHHFPALMYLGRSYLGEGKLGDAVSTLEKASNVFDATRGGTADMGVLCYYHLGRAYQASGWTDKATAQYERFLEIWRDADPGIKEIADARRRLAQLRDSS